ncbi:MAG TPA: hypothetical protein VFB08_02775 [Burkholderiales bacterium]|nr:hypothetical protein [Burkholderiales bacterium]
MATLREVLVQSVLIVLLLGSLAGIGIGIVLVLRAQAALGLFARLNHWVMSRADLRAREEYPVREHSSLTGSQRRIAGAIFASGGAFAAVVLASMPKIPAAALLQARGGLWAASFVVADAVRWLLVLGCIGAFGAGVLLLFFPATWAALEQRANRWHSTKQFFAQSDVMHLPLDRWVERSPRPAGAVIMLLSLISLAAFAALLLRR